MSMSQSSLSVVGHQENWSRRSEEEDVHFLDVVGDVVAVTK